MSVLNKIVILILLVVAGFMIWLLFIPDELPSSDFSSKNKIELFSRVSATRFANDIREAGYGIPTDSVIRRVGGIDQVEISGKLNLTVRVPSDDDDKILILFSTIINDNETQGTYFLDKHFNVTYSKYRVEGEGGSKEVVEIDPSVEKELVEQVQKELNQFLDRMKEQLD